jgi:hypothetical protein
MISSNVDCFLTSLLKNCRFASLCPCPKSFTLGDDNDDAAADAEKHICYESEDDEDGEDEEDEEQGSILDGDEEQGSILDGDEEQGSILDGDEEYVDDEDDVDDEDSSSSSERNSTANENESDDFTPSAKRRKSTTNLDMGGKSTSNHSWDPIK